MHKSPFLQKKKKKKAHIVSAYELQFFISALYVRVEMDAVHRHFQNFKAVHTIGLVWVCLHPIILSVD